MCVLRARYLSIIALALLVSSCRSTNPAFPPGLGSGGPRSRPVWIDTYPVDSSFYIGIGSSKTGDQGADMDAARARALANLASSISTQIRSEVLVTARDDSAGNSSQTAEQTLRETVDQNVREVEIVDSFYSSSDGYWFYVRLNKAAWASIQTEEMERLRRRVISLVEPDLLDSRVSIAARLGTLWKGWSLLAGSPYAGVLEATLLGSGGVLIDLIEREIVMYVDSMSVRAFPEVLRGAPGRPLEIEVEVGNNLSIDTGVFNVLITGPESTVITEISTGAGGRYKGGIDVGDIGLGTITLTATVDIGGTGVDFARIPKRMYSPERDVLLEMAQIKAALIVTASPDAEVPNIRGSIESLLIPRLPVKLGSAADAEYEVRADVQFRSAPANEYGIIVVYSKVVFSVGRNGSILASYETPEQKDGGLTLSQAQTRSLGKLIEAIDATTELENALVKAFSFE